jgi:hypothetical protein
MAIPKSTLIGGTVFLILLIIGLIIYFSTSKPDADPVPVPVPAPVPAPAPSPPKPPAPSPIPSPTPTPTQVPLPYTKYEGKELKKGWSGSGWSGDQSHVADFSGCEKNCDNNSSCYGYELNKTGKFCYYFTRFQGTGSGIANAGLYKIPLSQVDACKANDKPFATPDLPVNCVSDNPNVTTFWKNK